MLFYSMKGGKVLRLLGHQQGQVWPSQLREPEASAASRQFRDGFKVFMGHQLIPDPLDEVERLTACQVMVRRSVGLNQSYFWLYLLAVRRADEVRRGLKPFP